MDDYINTGAYLRVLWDELRHNMEHQLKEKGFVDVYGPGAHCLYELRYR